MVGSKRLMDAITLLRPITGPSRSCSSSSRRPRRGPVWSDGRSSSPPLGSCRCTPPSRSRLYPAERELVPEDTGTVLEALEEHHIVKWVLSELEDLDVDDERFEPKVTVLVELVRQHVREEEGDLFPAVRATVKRGPLGELGQRMERAKTTVPRRPHPRSPDTPRPTPQWRLRPARWTGCATLVRDRNSL